MGVREGERERESTRPEEGVFLSLQHQQREEGHNQFHRDEEEKTQADKDGRDVQRERERRISGSCWSERALLQKVRAEKRERACADELVSMLMRLRSRWPFTPLLDVSLQSASVAAAPDAHVLCQVCVEEN